MSLFSNCGAGDLGFANAGFAFEVMAELDERRLDVALRNHRGADGVSGDLRETLLDVAACYRKRAGSEPPALLAACPPCQGMSSAHSGRGLGSDADIGSRDHRNLLVHVIAEAVDQLSPRAIVVENVQPFLMRKVRHPRTSAPVSGANYLIDALGSDYVAYPLVANLADFGVPQSRKRSFLTFLRREEPGVGILKRKGWVPYPWPSHGNSDQPSVTLRDALASFDLPSLDARTKDVATSGDRMHSVPVWPPSRYRMVESIPANSGQSAWENEFCPSCGTRALDRQRVVCGGCRDTLPRPVTRGKDGQLRLVAGFHTSYRRMAPDEPAATITTASGHLGSDRTIHPWENRVLSPLECALLQTIPRSFDWGDALERWGHTNVRAMIGEAVPPVFTQKHGRVIAQLLRGVPPRVALSEGDARVRTAANSLARARASPLRRGPVNAHASATDSSFAADGGDSEMSSILGSEWSDKAQ